MQSTCGFSIAPRIRSVGSRSKAVWIEAIDPVELGEHLVLDVQRAVGADVHLDPAQDPERLQARVYLLDLLPLRLEPSFAQVVRVVGQAQERVPAPFAVAAISSIEFLPSGDHVEWQCISPLRSESSTSAGSRPSRAAASSPPFSRSSGGMAS